MYTCILWIWVDCRKFRDTLCGNSPFNIFWLLEINSFSSKHPTERVLITLVDVFISFLVVGNELRPLSIKMFSSIAEGKVTWPPSPVAYILKSLIGSDIRSCSKKVAHCSNCNVLKCLRANKILSWKILLDLRSY